MSIYEKENDKADRLATITQRIGFALWQLQELESVCATYFVLVEKATLGMGQEQGLILEKEVLKNTFGVILREITKAGLLSEDIQQRFKKLLLERNWLVHRSRSSSRSAIHSDTNMIVLLNRLDKISDEALILLTHVGKLAEAYVKKHGISERYIEKSKELLASWHSTDVF